MTDTTGTHNPSEIIQAALHWYQDLELPESEASQHAQWTTLRVVLSALSSENRKQFMTLLQSNPAAARDFADQHIPDLEDKIAEALAAGIKESMQKKEEKT